MHQSQPRAGVTLIELLVVISIMLTLTAIALATLPTSRFERQVREASRSVTALTQAARDLAIRTGRPHGILIERQSAADSQTGMVMVSPELGHRVTLVAQPPAYRGDFSDSRALVFYNPNLNGIQLFHLGPVVTQNGLPMPLQPGDFGWANRIRHGDIVRLQGVPFEFVLVSGGQPNNDGTLRVEQPPTEQNPWVLRPRIASFQPGGTQGSLWIPLGVLTSYAYTVEFAPERVPGRSVELPNTVGIDMNGSGLGINGFEFAGLTVGQNEAQTTRQERVGNRANIENHNPIAILFSPSGEIQRVMRAGGEQVGTPGGPYQSGRSSLAIRGDGGDGVPHAAIYLLLGKREQVGVDYLTPIEPRTNWNDAESLWLVLNPKTGRVKTSENMVPVDLDQLPKGQALIVARSMAFQTQGLGGN